MLPDDENMYRTSVFDASPLIYRFGRLVARIPMFIIAAQLLLVFVLGGYFMKHFFIVNDIEQLWSPYDSIALNYFESMVDLYKLQRTTEEARVLIEHDEGENVLTVESFHRMFEIDQVIRDISVRCDVASRCKHVLKSHKVDEYYGITYNDFCVKKRKDVCQVRTPLEFWHNYSHFQTQIGSNQTKLEVISADTFIDGEHVYRERIFGSPASLVVDETTNTIISSKAVLMTYFATRDWGLYVAEQWGFYYFEALGLYGADDYGSFKQSLTSPLKTSGTSQTQHYSPLRLHLYNFRSLEVESQRVIYENARFVLLEYVLMLVFVCVALSVTEYYSQKETDSTHFLNNGSTVKWYKFWEYSRITIGCAGVFSVFLSTLCGYGCCTWLGIVTSDKSDYWYKSEVQTSLPFNLLEMILPFILVAIGVDDMFILVANFRDSDPKWSLPDRFGYCLVHAMPSITFTTVTDIAAFGFGAITASVPAIKVFCVYASVSIFFDFIFQITFFLAVMVLDERSRVDERVQLPIMPSARPKQYHQVKLVEGFLEEDGGKQATVALPIMPPARSRQMAVNSTSEQGPYKVTMTKNSYLPIMPSARPKRDITGGGGCGGGDKGNRDDIWAGDTVHSETFGLWSQLGERDRSASTRSSTDKSTDQLRVVTVGALQEPSQLEVEGNEAALPLVNYGPSAAEAAFQRMFSATADSDSDIEEVCDKEAGGGGDKDKVAAKEGEEEEDEEEDDDGYVNEDGDRCDIFDVIDTSCLGDNDEETKEELLFDVEVRSSSMKKDNLFNNNNHRDHSYAFQSNHSSNVIAREKDKTKTLLRVEREENQDEQGVDWADSDDDEEEDGVNFGEILGLKTRQRERMLRRLKKSGSLALRGQTDLLGEVKRKMFPSQASSSRGESILFGRKKENIRQSHLFNWHGYVEVITFQPLALCIVVGTLLFSCAAGYWGLAHMETDFSANMLMPTGGYVDKFLLKSDHYGLSDNYFFTYDVYFHFDQRLAINALKPEYWAVNMPEEGSKEERRVIQSGAQVNSAVVQRAMLKFSKEHLHLKFRSTPRTDWLRDFLGWVRNGTEYNEYLTEDGYFDGAVNYTTNNEFRKAVSKFLFIDTNAYLQPSIIFDGEEDSTPKIKGSTISFFMTDAVSVRKKIIAMNSGFDQCEASPLNAYQFHPSFVFMSQFETMKEEMMRNFLACLLAAMVIAYFFLGHWLSILILVVSLTCIDVIILATMTYTGISLNSISVIALLMIVGLSVDYVAHIIHAYISRFDMDPRERLVHTFEHIGGSVMLGGLTTLVGVLPLAFTKAYTFYVFYVMFLGIIFTSLYFGLVFVPILMVYLVPNPLDMSFGHESSASYGCCRWYGLKKCLVYMSRLWCFNQNGRDEDGGGDEELEERERQIKRIEKNYENRMKYFRRDRYSDLDMYGRKKKLRPSRPITVVPLNISTPSPSSPSSPTLGLGLATPPIYPSLSSSTSRVAKPDVYSRHPLMLDDQIELQPNAAVDIQVYEE